jgi:hypothetical protein
VTARTVAQPTPAWRQPGFRFLPLDEHGRAAWPPGYEPQAHKRMPTSAQTLGQEAQRETNRERRATGEGWGNGTLALPGTPTTLAPAEPPRAPVLPRRDGWGVLPDSHIWLTLELIAHLRRPVTVGEVAEELRRSKNIARASLDVWLKRGVLRQVPSREPQRRGSFPPQDFALGAKAGKVWLRIGGRWA